MTWTAKTLPDNALDPASLVGTMRNSQPTPNPVLIGRSAPANLCDAMASSKGLRVVYDSSLNVSLQISISWNNGLAYRVGMSIQQAKELQALLSEVLHITPQP